MINWNLIFLLTDLLFLIIIKKYFILFFIYKIGIENNINLFKLYLYYLIIWYIDSNELKFVYYFIFYIPLFNFNPNFLSDIFYSLIYFLYH